MFVKSYKIVAPKRFEIYIEEIINEGNEAIVAVDTAAICKADLRYYLGSREKRILDLKYPMNLIHEAVGYIVKDKTGTFNIGDKVILVPNLIIDCDSNCTHRVCKLPQLGENYCPMARFASSNYNGFSRAALSYPVYNLVTVPKYIDNSISVFSELISVANAIIRRIELNNDDVIAIWGDGVLGYILCCVLKQITKSKIFVVGKHHDKMEMFPADAFYFSDDPCIKKENINTVFECVGGSNSEGAINNIIDYIVPGGRIVLSGVTEDKVRINTRKILEKGITLYGVTRSNVQDFMKSIEYLQIEEFRINISKLILDVCLVNSIEEYYNVFEKEAANKELGKYVIKFVF